MASVLLIHPSQKVLGKNDVFYSKEYLTPAIGLGMLAACLRQKGINVAIIDLRLPHRTIEDVFLFIEKNKPLMVGITAFTNEITAAGRIAEKIKERHNDCFVVAGGPHSTALPDVTLKEFPSFDAVAIGEGEETVVELSEMLISGQIDLSLIKGIAYKEGGINKVNPARENIADLDSLPFPAWDAFEIRYYTGPFMISSSRGCPYPCYFCTPNYLGKVRTRNPIRVVDEIQRNFSDFGASRFQFADATLSLLEKKTHILCDELINRGLGTKIEWDCETRADKIDVELLKKMRLAGCRWIAIGAETGSERILTEVIKKGETKSDIKNAVKTIKEIKIKVRCFFLLGHYTETADTIRETISFALEINPDAISFGLLVPNPGTELRSLAEKGQGCLRILHSNWENYSQMNFSCMDSVEIPLNELKRWQSTAYFTFYRHHPIKALQLFFNSSGYNYSLKGLIVIPLKLIRNFFNL